MDDNTTYERTGRTVEKYNNLKQKSTHVRDRIWLVAVAYASIGQFLIQDRVQLNEGRLEVTGGYTGLPDYLVEFQNLLSGERLLELFQELGRIREELDSVTEQLEGLAPHLLV